MVFSIENWTYDCAVCNFLHFSMASLKSTASCAKCDRKWHPIGEPSTDFKNTPVKRTRPKLLDEAKRRKEIRNSFSEIERNLVVTSCKPSSSKFNCNIFDIYGACIFCIDFSLIA